MEIQGRFRKNFGQQKLYSGEILGPETFSALLILYLTDIITIDSFKYFLSSNHWINQYFAMMFYEIKYKYFKITKADL